MAIKDIMPWRRHSRDLSPFESVRGLVEPMERFFQRGDLPKLEVEENPKEFIVRAELRGMKKEDVTVEVTEDTLTIRGEHSESQEKRRHGGLRRHESSRSFLRQIALPAEIKTAEVKAAFKHDSLEIRLPRVKEAPTRRIEIE